MLYVAQANRVRSLVAILVPCCLGLVAPTSSFAQTPAGVVPITSEPDHKIRFDNGSVRMYEVVLPKGKATLVHEHRADSFTVFVRTADVTNEPLGGKPVVLQRPPGFVGFTSTAKGPYSHRVTASGETTFHVIAMELLSPTPASSATATQRPSSTFKVVLESPRGRVYRVTLAPGESTETFARAAGSALFAISAGRISESADGKPVRLWDFEPGHFRWFETGEKLSVKNESSTPIDLVEIEVF
jgi:mannose-6-phosphate isomerase-like protein (cupin superfamily)